MNGLLWMAQILLAMVFVIAATGKLFAYDKVVKIVESRTRGHVINMTRSQAAMVGLAELSGALAVILPVRLQPPHLVWLVAASWLAFLMVGACIYHARRQESAAPSIAIFLLALFIIVGRWPR